LVFQPEGLPLLQKREAETESLKLAENVTNASPLRPDEVETAQD
jgi:hypothetical protein